MLRIKKYLQSAKFKRRVYTASILSLMGLVVFELATFNKPIQLGKRRAETSGYDGYDDD